MLLLIMLLLEETACEVGCSGVDLQKVVAGGERIPEPLKLSVSGLVWIVTSNSSLPRR